MSRTRPLPADHKYQSKPLLLDKMPLLATDLSDRNWIAGRKTEFYRLVELAIELTRLLFLRLLCGRALCACGIAAGL